MKYADIMRTYENKYLGAWDLIDDHGEYHEITFVIERVTSTELTREGGDKETKPVLQLKLQSGKPWSAKRPLPPPAVLTRRNAKIYRSVVGEKTDWEGQKITFFVEDRKNFGEMMPTLSVRGKSARGQAMKREMRPAQTPPDAPSPAPGREAPQDRQPGED